MKQKSNFCFFFEMPTWVVFLEESNATNFLVQNNGHLSWKLVDLKMCSLGLSTHKKFDCLLKCENVGRFKAWKKLVSNFVTSVSLKLHPGLKNHVKMAAIELPLSCRTQLCPKKDANGPTLIRNPEHAAAWMELEVLTCHPFYHVLVMH